MVSVSLFLGKGNTIHWNDYQIQALTTAVFPLDRSLEYTAFGLLSEIGEMAEAYEEGKIVGWSPSAEYQLKSETGDGFWYVAAIADSLNWRLADVANGYPGEKPEKLNYYGRGFTLLRLMIHAGNIGGIVKKAIRDNDGFLSPEAMTKLHKELWAVLWHLDAFAVMIGTTREALMSNNLNKLADRKTRGVLAGSGNNR